jgi:purine-binding chemotaxis protein CheW
MNSKSEAGGTPGQQFEQFVVFSLDNEEYAVPILSVAEVVPALEITPFPDAPSYILGLANLRGKILPVLDLQRKFQLSPTASGTRAHIMVAESEQKIQFGILVDQVKEVLKVRSNSVQPPPEMLKAKIDAAYLPGVIILESANKDPEKARMVLILDMQKILSDKNIEQLHALAQTAKSTAKEPINKEEP